MPANNTPTLTPGSPHHHREPAVTCPQSFGRYRIDRRLGEGGMGVVYLVRHPELEAPRALKVLRSGSEQDRLRIEGQLQANLQHDNIVRVYDAELHQGQWGLLLEYVDGPPLDVWLQQRRPSLSEAIHVFLAIVRGVQAAHAAGLVHRDLKPANVLMQRLPGDRWQPKITDFGLARLQATGGRRAMMSAGAMGTPAYAAPEQWRDAGSVDHRADIFALGCILYELVCGRRPFPGETAAVVRAAVAEGRCVPIRVYRSDVPLYVEAAIQGCLHVRPADRFESCADVLGLLETGGRENDPSGAQGDGGAVAPPSLTLLVEWLEDADRLSRSWWPGVWTEGARKATQAEGMLKAHREFSNPSLEDQLHDIQARVIRKQWLLRIWSGCGGAALWERARQLPMTSLSLWAAWPPVLMALLDPTPTRPPALHPAQDTLSSVRAEVSPAGLAGACLKARPVFFASLNDEHDASTSTRVTWSKPERAVRSAGRPALFEAAPSSPAATPESSRYTGPQGMSPQEIGRWLLFHVHNDLSVDGVDFTGAYVEAGDLRDADLTGAILVNAILTRRTDFTGAILDRADLRGAALDLAIMPNTSWVGARVEGVSLWYADLGGAVMAGLDLEGAEMSDSNLRYADLRDSNLSGASLQNADMQFAHADRSVLRGADLTSSNLNGASFRSANLQACRLGGSKLGSVNLAGADMRDADLNHADLTGTSLSGASLISANLRSSILRGAFLSKADLQGANLSHVDLRHASMGSANLLDAILEDADLRGAKDYVWKGDPPTRWPDGYEPEEHGVSVFRPSAYPGQ
ncbi:MAG: pentapeptide repeat-containing protein [Alphaproteobacteria bacterium]|nr:pentapeptide repeat-containing protein [Polyangiaceae bacterium]MCB9764778.1 pentapeptide repeat-containing protein [Alphaproteobacteria bacterium]